MSEYSEPISLDIDTTMMDDTEVQIILSHVRAIEAVVDGAKPQPESETVPEWRRLVDEAGTHWPHPLASVLSSLANIDGYGDGECYDVRPDLARIVAVCEAEVGDGWRADPEQVPRGHWGIDWLMGPMSHERPNWVLTGNRAAAWLRDRTEGAS